VARWQARPKRAGLNIFYPGWLCACNGSPGYPVAVRIELSGEALDIRLSWWQKGLGLMRDIHVPLAQISDVEVIEKPLAIVHRAGIKIGLRLPWLYFVARTIRLDEAFVVRRGMPALSFQVAGEGALSRVLVTTPEAEQLARRLRGD
jgi:hypothetical protein